MEAAGGRVLQVTGVPTRGSGARVRSGRATYRLLVLPGVDVPRDRAVDLDIGDLLTVAIEQLPHAPGTVQSRERGERACAPTLARVSPSGPGRAPAGDCMPNGIAAPRVRGHGARSPPADVREPRRRARRGRGSLILARLRGRRSLTANQRRAVGPGGPRRRLPARSDRVNRRQVPLFRHEAPHVSVTFYCSRRL